MLAEIKQNIYDVILDNEIIDRVYFVGQEYADEEVVRHHLIKNDGMNMRIRLVRIK